MEGLMALINSTEYAGFTIKEWNIVQFSKLAGILTAIAKEYETREVSFDALVEAFSAVDADGVKASALQVPKSLLKIMEPLITHSTPLLCVSLNTTSDKLEKVEFTEGIVLLLLVLKKNMEHLSGFFARLVADKNQ